MGCKWYPSRVVEYQKSMRARWMVSKLDTDWAGKLGCREVSPAGLKRLSVERWADGVGSGGRDTAGHRRSPWQTEPWLPEANTSDQGCPLPGHPSVDKQRLQERSGQDAFESWYLWGKGVITVGIKRCQCVCVSSSVVSNSLWPHGLWFTRLLCPWDSPGKNTGLGSHPLLQGTFLTQELNPSLLKLPNHEGKISTFN